MPFGPGDEPFEHLFKVLRITEGVIGDISKS